MHGAVGFGGLQQAERPVAIVRSNEGEDLLLAEFPPDEKSPLRSVCRCLMFVFLAKPQQSAMKFFPLSPAPP